MLILNLILTHTVTGFEIWDWKVGSEPCMLFAVLSVFSPIQSALQTLPTGALLPRLMLRSVQSLSRVQLCVTPWTSCTPGLPVHHQLPEFTQTHVHWVSDAIQPSHPLSSPSTPAFNLSQHRGLFKWVSSSQQVAKVLEFRLQHQSFLWIFRTDLL